MFKRLTRREIIQKLVDKMFKEAPDHWGFHFEPREDGGAIHDGVTYSADDLDSRPDFVKRDDVGWQRIKR